MISGCFGAIAEYPKLLGQVLKLNSVLDCDLEELLDRQDVPSMLDTKMLTWEQLGEIKNHYAYGIWMAVNIIVDAAGRKAIPINVTINRCLIQFGKLPGGRLSLPDNVKLTSCYLVAGVLMVGDRTWTGPCQVSTI